MNFKFIKESSIEWQLGANFGIRQLSKKGLLAYEYNPLKVLRYNQDYEEMVRLLLMLTN